ncbi:hypothetical protein PMIT1303_01309 [Prochlorococcus sp. MIT 1303]|nr:hypothetical protein PMIT1303_01309 [Prochlorococcus sp. MIT 1303]
MVLLRWLGCLVVSLSGLAWLDVCNASSWEQIGRYQNLLQQAGTNTLVADDCPSGLMGAFHVGRNAVLLCANNLEDDPTEVWPVLAHESAHVMQACKDGPLLADHQLGKALLTVQRSSPEVVRELRLYHQSQQREEVEARLVQALPFEEVKSLFLQYCADRLEP